MHLITNCHATLVFYNDIHNVWAYATKPCKVKNKDNVVPAWHFTKASESIECTCHVT